MAEEQEQPVGSVQRGRDLFAAMRDKSLDNASPAMRRGRELYAARHPQSPRPAPTPTMKR